jgi:hypothetical protein
MLFALHLLLRDDVSSEFGRLLRRTHGRRFRGGRTGGKKKVVVVVVVVKVLVRVKSGFIRNASKSFLCVVVVLVIFVLSSILSKNFLSKTEKATNRFFVARLFLLRHTVIIMKKMERDEEMKR